jgi:FtsP/CotA-like multicopper oxidase with cupredoxin domain
MIFRRPLLVLLAMSPCVAFPAAPSMDKGAATLPAGTPECYNPAETLPCATSLPVRSYYANSDLLRKFVDPLKKFGADIPVAVPDTTTYPGADYYEIGIVEYTQRMHSDLPKATRLRGFVQLVPDSPSASGHALHYPDGSAITWPASGRQVYSRQEPVYLGPLIVATQDRAVRAKMMNFLPTGFGQVVNGSFVRNGNSFLPVDDSIDGAGLAYTQNRVSIHLHGGDSPWINDGTPDQWFTPVGETAVDRELRAGASVRNVPDMPYPGEGGQTLYWPNRQSPRMMWYHDHAIGLTRPNAYAGIVAGYLIANGTEDAQLGIAGLETIPLVIQDKTFVPQNIAQQDPLWDTAKWGEPGDLWMPHVYEATMLDTLTPNPYGRWDYGGTTPFNAGGLTPFLELPKVSTVPEMFNDTPVVNGVAYPTVTVQPKAYRVRLLNGSNDRYLNLSLWTADPAVSVAGQGLTEVKLIDDGTGRMVPDPETAGPLIRQFATEAGLLPVSVPHAPAPIQLNDVGEVVPGSGLHIAVAERADTIIDFSAFAGKTLILYNDAVSPVPGGDPLYDYYTGNPDQVSIGGSTSTLAGLGPNTRTIMQIVVEDIAPAPAFDAAAFDLALASTYAAQEDPHIVSSTSSVAFNAATSELSIGGTVVPLKIRTIEGAFDQTFGRIISHFGIDLPGNATPTPLSYVDPPTEILSPGETQYWLLRNFDEDNHPIHFHLFNVQVLGRIGTDGVFREPLPTEAGWKETVQAWPLEDLIVALRAKQPEVPFGLPSSVRLLDPALPAGATYDTSLFGGDALAGTTAPYAFLQTDLAGGDVNGINFGVFKRVSNTLHDFEWEYVWHCHILGHEEFDLMRPMVFKAVHALPSAPTGLAISGNSLTWTDPTPLGGRDAARVETLVNPKNEYGFRVERAPVINGAVGTFTAINTGIKTIARSVNTPANAVGITDATAAAGTTYQYRVLAVNQSGASLPSNVVTRVQAPSAPTALGAVFTPGASASANKVTLGWTDNASNETGYLVTRATGTVNATTGALTFGAPTRIPTASSVLSANSVSFVNTAAAANAIYRYGVAATNSAGTSPEATASLLTATTVAAPTLLQSSGTSTANTLTIQWQATSSAFATGYEVQVCAGTAMTCKAVSAVWTPAAVVGSLAGLRTSKATVSGLTSKRTYTFRVRAIATAVAPALASTWVVGGTQITR